MGKIQIQLMDNKILHIKHLSKSFEGLNLFDDASLEISAGTINVLLGGNGSGKTTLFNMINGYEKPDAGEIWFNGLKLHGLHEYEIARVGMGRVWQSPIVFPNHTVLDNLLISSHERKGENILYCLFRYQSFVKDEKRLKSKALLLLEEIGMLSKKECLAGELSLGEKKILGIAMLLMNDSKLLLLDEPYSNITVLMIERISSILKDIREQGKTILMIEHKVMYARVIADKMYNINDKKIGAK